jgi:hypothetical protein
MISGEKESEKWAAPGSGKWYRGIKKAVVEDALQIDVRAWQRRNSPDAPQEGGCGACMSAIRRAAETVTVGPMEGASQRCQEQIPHLAPKHQFEPFPSYGAPFQVLQRHTVAAARQRRQALHGRARRAWTPAGTWSGTIVLHTTHLAMSLKN